MKKTLISKVVAGALLAVGANASAELSNDAVNIGVLTDLSGIYSAIEGPGGVIAAEMAVEDFGGSVLGKKINITSADTQSKADLSGSKAREMFERDNVDMIVGNVSTASALAAMEVADQMKRVALVTARHHCRLPTSVATPTPCTGSMTPMRWLTARVMRWWPPAKKPGSL